MRDTYAELPLELWHRVVKRDPNGPFAYLNERVRPPHALPQGGASSTAWDLALFGQLFLDGGWPVLSRASVAAMTRDHVDGVEVVFGDRTFPPTGWGYGWRLSSGYRWPHTASLLLPEALQAGGAGGSFMFVAPTHDLIGVCLSVVARLRPNGLPHENRDLFANAVAAAVVD